MLNNIKQLINSKKAYMEAAELILEDTELDDSIILNEEPEEVPLPQNKPEDEEPELGERPEDSGEGDLNLGGDAEPEGAELPTPETPTGEVPSDDSANIMTTEIDLQTNTPTDILPVPPAGAADAIEGNDLMSQPVDSGFGDDENKAPIATTIDIMSEPVDEPETKVGEDDNPEGLSINEPAGAPADEAATDLGSGLPGDREMANGIAKKQEANRSVYAENDDDVMGEDIESVEPTAQKENNDSDDIMSEAVDDNKIESNTKKKEKDYLQSYKEDGSEEAPESAEPSEEPKEESKGDDPKTESSLLNDDMMTMTEINEAVDDNKIESHEKKLEEQEKKVQSSDPATPGEDGAKTESTKEFTEGISLGDESATDGSTDASADASADAGAAEAPADAPAEDNAVTSAVKDKVDEITSDTEPEEGGSNQGGEELMKKLSALTKSIEDAKALVLKGLH